MTKKLKNPQKHRFQAKDVDPFYAAERNKNVPAAVKVADEGAGPAPEDVEMRMAWNGVLNKIFHTKMNELWAGAKNDSSEKQNLG